MFVFKSLITYRAKLIGKKSATTWEQARLQATLEDSLQVPKKMLF